MTGRRLDRLEPEITFTAFGVFRRIQTIEVTHDVGSHDQRIDHHTLGRNRVSRHTVNFDANFTGIERFHHNFATLGTVNRVSEVNLELIQIQSLGTEQTDFFIRHKSHADITVRTIFLDEDFQGLHDVGKTGLVISPQHTRTVRKDDVLTDIVIEFRMLSHTDPKILFCIQANVTAFVMDHLGMHFIGQPRRHRVHVSTETHSRYTFHITRQISRHTRMLIDVDVLEPQGLQFVSNQLSNFPLTFTTGNDFSLRNAFGRDCHVTQKTINQCFGVLLSHGSSP